MNIRRIIHEIYQQEKSKPLSWEDGGCLRFPALVAKAITGSDPTEKIRGQFKTESEAKRLLVANGCKSLGDMAAKAYAEITVTDESGQKLPAPSFARAGDWAVVRNEDGSEGLGVVMGAQIAVYAPSGAIGTLPLTSATSAYRVE